MQSEQNLAHWESWAADHKEALRATTKCQTIKRIELHALKAAIARHCPLNATVLEVGCGNGINPLGLIPTMLNVKYTGIDFSPAMIEAAKTNCKTLEGRAAFAVGDARDLAKIFKDQRFDAVFTDRMIINLASAEEQLKVMKSIASILKPGGHFFMLENSVGSHRAINDVRQHLGLARRPVAEYNIFVDESTIKSFEATMKLVDTQYISGMHDLLLYAVQPAATGQSEGYDSPLMKSLTEALLSLSDNGIAGPQSLGQNVLWIWQKEL